MPQWIKDIPPFVSALVTFIIGSIPIAASNLKLNETTNCRRC
jgi:hypothetical protein